MSAFLDFLVKWRKSSGNRLFDLLVTAAKPVKDMPERRDMLEAEKEQVAISFGDVRTLAISGDSLDKILVKPDGSGSCGCVDLSRWRAASASPCRMQISDFAGRRKFERSWSKVTFGQGE